MKLSGRLLLLAVALMIVALLVARDSSSATSDHVRNYVSFTMTSTDRDYSDGSVELQLAVRSVTDMPVPGVRVVLGHCANAQTTPFSLASRTRHLVLGQESLKAFNDGEKIDSKIEWWLASAPANTEPYRVLKLKLRLPVNKGGPTFCVTGAASSPYDTGPQLLRKYSWRLNA